MGLTEVARLRLEAKSFEKLFTDHETEWTKMAERAKKLIADQLDHGEPTVDDIKKTLLPLVEIHPTQGLRTETRPSKRGNEGYDSPT